VPFGFSLLEGLLMAVAAVALLVGGRFLVAIANDEEPREAISITSRWTLGLIGAAGAAGGMGLVQFADIVGMVTMFIGSHPFAVSNGLVAAVGAATIGGFLSLSPEGYLGVSVALIGAVMLLYEVVD
jgi:hypothetical protein